MTLMLGFGSCSNLTSTKVNKELSKVELSDYEKDQQFIDSLAAICRDYIETKELYIIDCEICGELISSDSLLLTEEGKEYAAEKYFEELWDISEKYNPWGSYTKKYFVDDFREYTKDAYISSDEIPGSFSNSATTNSDLDAKLLLTDEGEFHIFLYEYAGNHSTTGYSDSYKILVKSGDNKLKLFGSNYNDRVVFKSSKLINLMREDKAISFVLIETGYGSSEYRFTLPNNGFDYSYSQLKL